MTWLTQAIRRFDAVSTSPTEINFMQFCFSTTGRSDGNTLGNPVPYRSLPSVLSTRPPFGRIRRAEQRHHWSAHCRSNVHRAAITSHEER